jgi:hypothetical protein
MNLPAFVKKKFIRILDGALSYRHKRMVFFASLTARLRDTEDLDAVTRRNLNDAMQLATRDDALSLAARTSKLIWKSVTDFDSIKEQIMRQDWSKENISKICTAILQRIPDWLFYSNRKTMAADVELYIRHHQVVIGV